MAWLVFIGGASKEGMQEEEEEGERIQVTAGALQLDLRDAGRIQSHKN